MLLLKTLLTILCIVLGSLPVWSNDIYSLSSPSKGLKAEIQSTGKYIQIGLSDNGTGLLEVRTLQFVLDKEIVAGDWRVTEVSRAETDETWQPVYGEHSSIHNRYHEVRLLLESTGNKKRVVLKIRLYDEGLAFRYDFDKLDFWNRELVEEKSQFLFPKDCVTWVTERAQGVYTQTTLSDLTSVCDRPQVIEVDKNRYVAIGEAALVDYARMKLGKSDSGQGLQSKLSGKVLLDLAGYHSPWRYIMVAEHPGKLVQNNYFLLNLNEPNEIEDTSWIKPGKIIREATLTTAGGLACVDWAASHNIEYVEFDAGWYGPEYDPASDATTVTVDPKRSKGPLDLHRVIQYAQSKGIGIVLYVNMKALHNQLDEILPLYQEWGVKGVKFGFVDVGDQYSTAWLHHAVRKAAKYKLMVDIHDEYRPTGYSRTYPNLITQEGIRGDEESPSLQQAVYTFYNRMICGAGDYTNCYFAKRVVDKMGGRASQLAKLIAIYSPWQFIYWYDRPPDAPAREGGAGSEESIIREDDITDFYCSIPTVWDETRFLEGEMGVYSVVARRSGTNWYVSILNAEESRKISLPSDMLKGNNGSKATLYYQDPKKRKDVVSIKKLNLRKQKEVVIDVTANSGCVIHWVVKKDQ